MSKSARDVMTDWLTAKIFGQSQREMAERATDAILAALREAGYKLAGPDEVVVPREPTPEMHGAGFRATDMERLVPVSAIYRAMLSAAPSARPEGEGE